LETIAEVLELLALVVMAASLVWGVMAAYQEVRQILDMVAMVDMAVSPVPMVMAGVAEMAAEKAAGAELLGVVLCH
jgi:hypothetical protein